MHTPRKGNGRLGKRSDKASPFVHRIHREMQGPKTRNTEFQGFRRSEDAGAERLDRRWKWSGNLDRDYRDSEL